jgi:osmoprotectant transport system ATP-binding protein
MVAQGITIWHQRLKSLNMPGIPFIRISDVGKSYDGGRTFAVRDASLAIAKGSFVSVVGASGSGKTTVLKFINRLIQPDTGTICIDGRDTVEMEITALRRGIGYVFQNVGLFPHLTVGENIGITPQLLEWPPIRIAARIEELLDLVELPRSYATRRPATLSGGERQRVGVARAISAYPKIVLMDEPFGALDPITRDIVGSTYKRLHNLFGLTTMMVTHDVQEAILLSDQIAVMKEGRIIASDTPRALIAESQIDEVISLMAMPKRQADQVRVAMGNSDSPNE